MESEQKTYWVETNTITPKRREDAYFSFIVFFITGSVLLYFAISSIGEEGSLFLISLFGPLGIFLCCLPIYLFFKMKRYMQKHIRLELREDGYFISYFDENTNKKFSQLLPYENMEFVLISLDFVRKIRSRYNFDRRRVESEIDKYAAARLHIKGTNSEGEKQIRKLFVDTPMTLNIWTNVLKEKGVPIFYTEYALNNYKVTEESIYDIPMEKYEGELPFTFGKYIYDPDEELELLTEEQKQKQLKRISRIRKFVIILGLLQIPITSLLLPHATIVDGFIEDTYYGVVWIVTLFTLIFINIPAKRKWYEPFMDVFIIVAGAMFGTFLVKEATYKFREAILINYLCIGVPFLVAIYIKKISSWISKKNMDRRKNSVRQFHDGKKHSYSKISRLIFLLW